VNGKGGNVFPSPVYDSLETNIPHTLMNFSDKPFPQNCPLFPDYRTVKRYLEKYAEEIRDHFRLGSQVVQVWPVEGEGNDLPRWRVLYIEQASETNHEQTFDAVVCASGHYSDPFVPNIRGIAEFSMSHPGIISHSKYYRRPDKYAKKVSW
jgi:cation diffusion facilitator CzcD-associated flavoprotein CzcO